VSLAYIDKSGSERLFAHFTLGVIALFDPDDGEVLLAKQLNSHFSDGIYFDKSGSIYDSESDQILTQAGAE
jgi:hypothetical protein